MVEILSSGDSVTEMIKSASFDRILHQHTVILDCLYQAIDLAKKAQDIAESLSISCPTFFIEDRNCLHNKFNQYVSINEIHSQSSEDILAFVRKDINSRTWEH